MVSGLSLTSAALTVIGLLVSSTSAKPMTRRASTPFDGQYINPTANNTLLEWWWAEALAEPVGNNAPAAVQVIFYMVNGFFPNGTAFEFILPASDAVVTANGQQIVGVWESVGGFETSAGFSSFGFYFNGADLPLKGSVVLSSRGPHHFGCNSTSSPYFESATPSGSLNSAEEILYNQLGWVTTIPGGKAHVNLLIDGVPLIFKGTGYHDANWLPLPLNEVVTTWYFGSGSVGDYDFSYVSVQAINSTRTFNTGFLSHKGVILQNQCNTDRSDKDFSRITPYGSVNDTATGVILPTGYILEYFLENGDHYSFNLSSYGQNPDQIVYHRWVGTAIGGKVGDSESNGMSVFEWLNPGLVPYTPSQ